MPANTYTFDVKLFATITIKAASQAEAEATIRDVLDGASCNAGAWPNGDPSCLRPASTVTSTSLKENDTMTAPTYNILAVRKTIAAVHHRLAEANLDTAIRRRIILRQLADLRDTLLPKKKFDGILTRCEFAINEGDKLELVAGLDLIASLLPHLTYGCVLQGQVFEAPDRGLYLKSKAGRVELLTGTILPHFPADLPVKLVNE